jgi:hypothetical protein
MAIPSIRIPLFLIVATTLVAPVGCRRHHEPRDEGAGEPADLYLAICTGKRVCDDFDSREPARFFDAFVGITDCVKDAGALFGSWQIEDADSRPFEWKANVRRGGVFPSLGHTATNLGCGFYRPQAPLANGAVALDPDGFAWAKLERDDVFIPLGGEATIRHEFHATASLDQPGDASIPRTTVSVEGSRAARTVYAGLGRGDRFPWGKDGATVVRVVGPQSGVLGAIGWVEIELTAADLSARDR